MHAVRANTMHTEPLKLITFDQSFAVFIALVVSVIFWLVWGRRSANPGIPIAGFAAAAFLAVSALSFQRLQLTTDAVEYRTAFTSDKVFAKSIERVSANREWSLLPLPAQYVIFVLDGSEGVNGSIIRIGVFSWPEAKIWARELNETLGKP